MSKQESETKVKRRYKKKWEIKYPWLKCSVDGEHAYCTYCNTNVLPKVYNISVHEKTKKHQDNSVRGARTALDGVIKFSMEDQTKQEMVEVSQLVFAESDLITPSEMPKHERDSKTKRRYKEEWELQFSWLKCSDDGQKAYCTYCNTNVLPKVYNISVHEKTKKHQDNSLGATQTTLDDVFTLSMEDQERDAEMEASIVAVHGVDMTEEVQGALTALKTKLSLLSEHLYCVEDPAALIDCLRAMSSIGSVIEKYKKLW